MVLPILALSLLPPIALLVAIIGLWRNPSQWRVYLPLYIYVIFIGAYCYVPMQGSNVDLVRYLPTIEEYGRLSLMEALGYSDDILFATDILFWICGHLRLPHLVPAFTTATVYAVSGYMTCDVAERYESNRYIGGILLFQFMMIPYISIINNIRNVFGLSVIILGVYLDLVKRKKNALIWFLYISGSLMHLSCFIIVVFRILSGLSKKFFEALLLIPAVFSSVIFLLYNNRSMFNFGGLFGSSVQRIIQKLYGYLINTTSEYAIAATTALSYVYNRWIMMVGVFLLLILLYYMIRYKRMLFKDNIYFYSFAGMIASLTLACNVFAIPNYWRFAAAMYVLSGTIFVPLLCNRKRLPVFIKTLLLVSLCLGPLGLFIHYWQNRSYDFTEWAINSMLTNYLTIFYYIFKFLLGLG